MRHLETSLNYMISNDSSKLLAEELPRSLEWLDLTCPCGPNDATFEKHALDAIAAYSSFLKRLPVLGDQSHSAIEAACDKQGISFY